MYAALGATTAWFAVQLASMPNAAAAIDPEVFRRTDAAVACVESANARGDKMVGTAFFVAPGILATSSHQLGDRGRISVHVPGGGVRSGVVLVRANHADVALLGVDTAGPPPLAMTTDVPSPGSEVFTIGCPLGLEHSLTSGTISNSGRTVDGMRMIQTAIDVNHGNSGGPLLDRDGRVVGLVVGFLRNAKAIDFAAPAEEIAKLMERAGTRPAPAGAEVDELWRKAQNARDTDARIAAYQQLLVRAPWLAEGWYNLGAALYQSGRFDEAADRFRTAVAQRPRYYQAYTNLGLALYRLGRHAQARDALRQAVDIKSDYALAQLNLGIVYREGLGEQAAAERAFRRFLELSPNAPEAAEVRRWLR